VTDAQRVNCDRRRRSIRGLTWRAAMAATEPSVPMSSCYAAANGRVHSANSSACSATVRVRTLLRRDDRIEGVIVTCPVMRDPDGYVYFKEEVGGLLVVRERNDTPRTSKANASGIAAWVRMLLE